MSIELPVKYLQRELKARNKQIPQLIVRAQKRAAVRARPILVRKTPVDRGQMRNGWRVVGDARFSAGKNPAKIKLVNDAPYAGVVERGARPHRVNRAGREALEAWARRKLGVSRQEARSISFAIAKKLEKQGQKGLFFVQDSLPELRALVKIEFDRRLKRAAKKTASKKRLK